MRFRRVGPDSYTLSLSLNGGEYAYNLTMVLRTTPLETQERPTSSAEYIEEYAPLATSIPPLPVHTPSNLRIVPPGVPFQVPCPRCQTPLERGEICQNHFGKGITLICQGPEAPLAEHHQVPFLFLQSSHRQPNFLVESDSTRATCATSPASSDTLSPDLPPSLPNNRHACYRAPSPNLPADVPAGELRVREGMGRETFAKVWDGRLTELHQVPGAEYQGPPQDVVERRFAHFETPWEVTLLETVRTWKILKTLEDGAQWVMMVGPPFQSHRLPPLD